MDNLRGILLMTVAMAGFAIEDTFIKRVSDELPTGQILMTIGTGGAIVYGLLCRRRGARVVSRDFLVLPVILRNLGEMVGTFGFVTAIVLTPLSSASAILQAAPLLVTLGAALFLGEQVGWRRWTAIAVGLAGVLMILRPGLAGFQPASLFAVLGVLGLGARDVATRAIPARVATVTLATYAFATMFVTGAVLLAVSGGAAVPSAGAALQLLCGFTVGVSGYYAVTGAMRVGEVALVTPFRYTRLVFALIFGITVFGERPDALTLTGAGIVIASGLYTLYRERRSLRPRRGLSPGGPPV